MTWPPYTVPVLKPVTSSNIAAYGYDVTSGRLYVQFVSGYIYVYETVDPTTYASFDASDSKGRALHKMIIPGHTATKIDIERENACKEDIPKEDH